MKVWSPARFALVLVTSVAALGSLAGCGPNESDRANMKDKMDLEAARAKIWAANLKDCTKLGAEAAAFSTANKDRIAKSDAWWAGVGTSAKRTLIAENQAAWDAQGKAVMNASIACPNEVKITLKEK